MMEMAHLITFGGITEVAAPPLLKISANEQVMNIKSNKIAWRSKNKIVPRRKKKEVKHDDRPRAGKYHGRFRLSRS